MVLVNNIDNPDSKARKLSLRLMAEGDGGSILTLPQFYIRIKDTRQLYLNNRSIFSSASHEPNFVFLPQKTTT